MATFLFVARPLKEIDNHRERRAIGDLNAEAARKQREKMISLRAELNRYEANPDLSRLSAMVADKEVHMNLLFEQLSSLASDSGISIQSFERVGQGLNSDGFVQVSLDTNFLQMSAFMSALAQASFPIHVLEFSARQSGDSPDKILFLLTISLAALQSSEASKCLQ